MSFGIHLSSLIPPFPFHLFHPSPPQTREIDLYLTSFSLVLYLMVLICYFVTDNLREELTFPLLLAPAAATIRYYLSRANPRNGKYGGKEWGLPWGTGVGNLVGTGLLGALFLVQRGNLKLKGGECIVSLAVFLPFLAFFLLFYNEELISMQADSFPSSSSRFFLLPGRRSSLSRSR